MQTRPTLTPNELTDLIVQVRTEISYENLQRGFDAFKKHAVNYFQITDKSMILAKVKMPEFYDIQLDLDFLSISTCTCSSSALCEHMAAVFFAVYQLHNGSVDEFMQESHTAMNELQAVQELKAAKAEKAQRNEAMERAMQQQIRQAAKPTPPDSKGSVRVSLEESGNVEEWHRYFLRKFTDLSSTDGQSVDYNRLVQTLSKSAASWEPNLRKLFEIHVRLYVLTHIEKSFIQREDSYLHFLYQNHLSEMAFDYFGEISDYIADIQVEEMTDTYLNVFEGTALVLARDFCHESIAALDTYTVYNMFCKSYNCR